MDINKSAQEVDWQMRSSPETINNAYAFLLVETSIESLFSRIGNEYYTDSDFMLNME